MSKPLLPGPQGLSLSRRRFVTGMVAGSTLLGMGVRPARATTEVRKIDRLGPNILQGHQFDLSYTSLPVNFTGTQRYATAINGSVPAPILRWREGDTVTLNVTNHLDVDTSIHWHGVVVPTGMDGVPHLSFHGIKPGATFTYQFPVRQSGTYWYHSHSGFQEQTGAYGAIIIDPKEKAPFKYEREYVVMLSDWTDEEPSNVYAKLKKMSDYYNFRERTVSDMTREVGEKGWSGFAAERGMWNEMRMSDRDISDVTGYTYTYLMNGVTPAEGWLGLFRRGEKIRLRFINASAMTFFDVRIPGLKLTVVAADGQYIKPVEVDEFRMGVAETYDVIVEPQDQRAYTVFAQAIDRSGYACGSLTPDLKLTAEVPAMDPAPILGHSEMGMDMSGMDHSGMNMSGMDHSGHDMSGMDHSGMNMSGMDHSGHDMSGMGHSGMNMSGMGAAKPTMGTGKAGFGSSRPVAHTATEYGPHVDMRADSPQYRLDDPGFGLRNNGRRVLTYADLRNLHRTPDKREPSREIDLHLTGNMSRYMWSINGIRYEDAEPLNLHYGERVRINLFNDTMMYHPIHLHGMWSDLETGDPDYIPRKHTIVVAPGTRISYLVTADAKGNWAYHCHLLYHMLAMARRVVVS